MPRTILSAFNPSSPLTGEGLPAWIAAMMSESCARLQHFDAAALLDHEQPIAAVPRMGDVDGAGRSRQCRMNLDGRKSGPGGADKREATQDLCQTLPDGRTSSENRGESDVHGCPSTLKAPPAKRRCGG